MCECSLCVTWSLAVHGPVSGPSTLVAGVTLTTEAPSEASSSSSAKKSTPSTKAFAFQLEFLHVHLKNMHHRFMTPRKGINKDMFLLLWIDLRLSSKSNGKTNKNTCLTFCLIFNQQLRAYISNIFLIRQIL